VRNKSIALAALGNLSCAGGILFAFIVARTTSKTVFAQPRPNCDIGQHLILQ
jgi:hypothetical protein